MKVSILPCFVLLTGLVFRPNMATAATTLQNEAYRLTVEDDGSLSIVTEKLPAQLFAPKFVVLETDADPKVALRWGNFKGTMYNITSWEVAGIAPDPTLKTTKVNTAVLAGDGFDNRILKGEMKNRTANLFAAGKQLPAGKPRVSVSGSAVHWDFPQNADFSLSASIEMPPGQLPPQLRFQFSPKKAGYYSVGYLGAPAAAPGQVDDLWQPLIWTEKRFPQQSILTMAFHCPVPATLVARSGVTTGLVVSPAELPFQPLPTFDNSRFGVAVRNAQGEAQPMVFAPALGGTGSAMKAGDSFGFGMGLFVCPGHTVDAFEHIAKVIYGFKDYRSNGTCSLNQTLENEVEYGLSAFSRFNSDQRGCSYETDVPGAVKNVSALHPLEMALVTDDPRIYRERARPIMEFLLSRENLLFCTNPKMKVQNPGRLMTGPCAPVSELANLYLMGQKRTPLFLNDALEVKKANANKAKDTSWADALALYRATGDKAYLKQAMDGADAYIASRVMQEDTDFARHHAFFWTQHAPDFVKLCDLYEETGEWRYIQAAEIAARRFTEYVWFCPAIPGGNITVNQGGVAPQYWYIAKRGNGPMKIPEESVPAWRLSEIGLTCEASGTSAGHRAIFMANFASWLMRIAYYTGNTYLHDIARSAVVGRSANFPGYHMNTARTTVYEKADYPLHDFKDLTYNSFHFNHIWPHMAMLVDYLVSDAVYRSHGGIDFAGRFSEGYAYLQNRVYGDQPGHIYGDKEVWLWMPRGLARTGSIQLNYLAARGKNTLYLVLMNESLEPVNAPVQLDGNLVDLSGAKRVRVWTDNRVSEATAITGGRINATVTPHGITVLAIDGAQVHPKFQDRVLAAGQPLSPASFTQLAYGRTHAMLLSMGSGMTHAYVYLEATGEELKAATLHYRTSPQGEWKTALDASYPFEFTVEMAPQDAQFQFYVEGAGTDGKTSRSEEATLRR